jgi:hypothetical protein
VCLDVTDVSDRDKPEKISSSHQNQNHKCQQKFKNLSQAAKHLASVQLRAKNVLLKAKKLIEKQRE